jgi:hypothetical protein
LQEINRFIMPTGLTPHTVARETGADMGNIGNPMPGHADDIEQNSSSAFERFNRPLAPHEERALRREMLVAVIGVLCVLALIGWALTR